jgi:hypothetical protein
MLRCTTHIALALVALTAALALSAVAHAHGPVFVEEVQGWTDDGRWTTEPVRTHESDEHIHTLYTLEQFTHVTAPVPMTVRVLGHHSTALIRWVRWSCESDVKQVVDLNHRFTGAHEEWIDVELTIRPSLCPAGWREIRITPDVRRHGLRDFGTTRLCVRFGTASGSNYCGGPTQRGRCGGGWWYSRTEYMLGFVDCRDLKKTLDRPLEPGERVRVKSQGGRLYVLLDPALHAGSRGLQLVENARGRTWRAVTIPTDLEPGAHKLHIRAQRHHTGEAGGYVLNFTVAATSGAQRL